MRFTILALLLGTPATLYGQGSDTPVYDIRAYCGEVSRSVGGSYQIEAGCVELERTSLATVRAMNGVESRIMEYCDEVASTVGGSYQIYEGCLSQELDAKRSLDE